MREVGGTDSEDFSASFHRSRHLAPFVNRLLDQVKLNLSNHSPGFPIGQRSPEEENSLIDSECYLPALVGNRQ